jgi:hypothetical protein
VASRTKLTGLVSTLSKSGRLPCLNSQRATFTKLAPSSMSRTWLADGCQR